MREIKISEEVKKLVPKVSLGVIKASVKVEDSLEPLLKEMDDYSEDIKNEIKLEELAACPRIKDGREAYKALGKSPSKYRLSSEALLRRVLQGKGLYRVNNIVDINNLISIKSQFPVGSYDMENIKSSIILNRAEEGAKYKGIGKDLLNIEHLPVLCDNEGAFGSPTSDSERAMVKDSTKEIIMCIYSFRGEDNLQDYLEEAKALLEKYANGHNFETTIVK